MKKILTIDGGGIRGIIPAMLLAQIERNIKKPVCEIFDLIAGTSTGGILALALAKPGMDGKPQYSASDLIALYEKEGRTIFSTTIWDNIKALGSIADEKYPSSGIESVLEKYFGNELLKNALTNILVLSYETELRTPWLFKSHDAKDSNDKNAAVLMKEAARATSAAPTYFEPARIQTNTGKGHASLIDGGLYANNPSMCAYMEAKSIFKDDHDFLMVSLGTGENKKSLMYEEIKDWGLAKWAKSILDVVFDGVGNITDKQVSRLISDMDGSPRYYRLQVELEPENGEMDDASQDNIEKLKVLTDGLIQKDEKRFMEICQKLLC